MPRATWLVPTCLRARSAPRPSATYDPINRIVRIGVPITGSLPEPEPSSAIRYTKTEIGNRSGSEITRGDHSGLADDGADYGLMKPAR